MKSRHILVTTSLIGALAGATPAIANPLGIVSGGAGAFGALGGTLSGPSAAPMLGVGSAIGAAGQFQGAITQPGAVIDPSLAGHASGFVQSTGSQARARIEGAGDATLQQSSAAVGEVGAAAATAANANAAGRLLAVNPLRVRPPRSLEAGVSARGDASGSASAGTPSASASAEAEGSAQSQAQVKR